LSGQPERLSYVDETRPLACWKPRLRLITYLAPSLPPALFDTIARHVGADVVFEERISGPLAGDDEPFSRGEADIGFVCAPSYRVLRGTVELLPALVPLDARANARPVYFADVIVRNDAPFRSFHDLRGAHWAYNDRNSRSGWFSMLDRVGGDTRFFSELAHAGSHLQSLEAVRDGRVDGAAIDSNVLLRRPHADLHVIESWGPFAIQPVIVRNGVDDGLKSRVAEALLEIDNLAPFGFARFARVTAAAYE